MADFYSELSEALIDFIKAQKIFFVASTPPAQDYPNVSPKGDDSLSVLDSKTIAYIDYPGSGNATAQHISQGGRVTMMFCSFDEKPMVLRLYGRGEVIPASSEKAKELAARMKKEPPAYARQIVVLHIERAMTSCGYGVPLFAYMGERPTLIEWCRRKLMEGKLGEYLKSIWK